MTTAKELAAATQAQRLAEGYRKRFEAAAMGADNADDVTCSLARTLLRRASESPQPEPVPIPADTRAVAGYCYQVSSNRPLGLKEIINLATPIPADTRDVVRGALNAALAWEGSRAAYLAEKALAALDAAPAESETLGYGVLTDGLGLSFRTTRAEADTTAAIMRGAGRGKFRIVRLVAEDE